MRVSSEETGAGGFQPSVRVAEPKAESEASVRVWDSVVRLFHWSLVAAFVVAWATGDEARDIHETVGYLIVGLLGVRLVWGVVGSTHARFSDFVHRPTTVLAYLAEVARFRAKRHLGHNPAGGAMVIALMAMIAAICTTGIMMTTDAFWGVEWVEGAHAVAVNLTIVLIGLHLVGVFVASAEHRENLVKAMITGRKRR